MDYNFVSNPEESLLCLICNKVAIEGVQETCGKLFCATCIEDWNDNSCPFCETPTAKYFVDNKSREEINALVIYCDHKDNGCEWEGTVGTLEDHVTQCDFASESYYNECTIEMGQRLQEYHHFVSNPEDSLRCTICNGIAIEAVQETCGKVFCSAYIEDRPEDSCPSCKTPEAKYFVDNKSRGEINKLAVRCANGDYGCEWEGTFGTLEDHWTKCDFASSVSCPNQCLDETHQWLRKDLNIHLSYCCPKREIFCDKKETYRFVIGAYDNKCEMKILDCTSEGCTLLMEHIKTDVGDFPNVHCNYSNIGCETITLLRNITRRKEDSQPKFTFMAISKKVKKEQVEPNDFFPYEKPDNSFMFRLNGYSYKKRSHTSEYFKPFFTSASGYKIGFNVLPIGCHEKEGSHVSVFLEIWRGPHDDKLEWPLKAAFIVELLNQLADRDHHKMTIEFDGKGEECKPCGRGWGKRGFIAHSKLLYDAQTNTQYLKDDMLDFRVTSTVLN